MREQVPDERLVVEAIRWLLQLDMNDPANVRQPEREQADDRTDLHQS